MSKKVVVADITIQCVFGVVDEDGDMVQKQPFSVQVPKLKKELFAEAVKALLENKAKMQAQLDDQDEDE